MTDEELAVIRARVPSPGDDIDRYEDWFCEHACADAAALLAEVDRLHRDLDEIDAVSGYWPSA
jgi:hypothetical protein